MAQERCGEVGGLAQLARAPALQAGGHRFESDILHGEANSEQKTADSCRLKAKAESGKLGEKGEKAKGRK
jgi:hypothetical protein